MSIQGSQQVPRSPSEDSDSNVDILGQEYPPTQALSWTFKATRMYPPKCYPLQERP